MIRSALIAALLSAAVTIAGSAVAQEDDDDDSAESQATEAPVEIDHRALAVRSLGVLDRQFAAFRDAAAALADTAAQFCAGEVPQADLDAAFAATWVAWAPLDSYQFGPIQTSGAALVVNFLPDEKNFVGRGLRDLLEQPPAKQADPGWIAQLSAATQGLPALELLLTTDAPECPAAVGISGNLARVAGALYAEWFGPDGWSGVMTTAGPDNPVYRTPAEVTRTLYTALDFGLERVEAVRIGRPLGSFEQSFPTRAEAWRSGLTNGIIAAQLDGARALVVEGFGPDLPADDLAAITALFDEVDARLAAVGMPIGEAVKDPVTRFRVETLETRVEALKAEVATEVGPNLGVETGFSSADGD